MLRVFFNWCCEPLHVSTGAASIFQLISTAAANISKLAFRAVFELHCEPRFIKWRCEPRFINCMALRSFMKWRCEQRFIKWRCERSSDGAVSCDLSNGAMRIYQLALQAVISWRGKYSSNGAAGIPQLALRAFIKWRYQHLSTGAASIHQMALQIAIDLIALRASSAIDSYPFTVVAYTMF